MNRNETNNSTIHQILREKFLEIYRDFPFSQTIWGEILGISTNMFHKKFTTPSKKGYEYYHFTQEDIDKAKNYIKEKSKKYL
ncbi:hypothetical protein WAF17_22400 (plasmid) [Bernardetia sp. ABR2-2B]|uniref:hypothetical protein n=1 Tax=Bernardetia sp. ABR2-2B TaxID=3127472 RepID=UPI0030CA6D7E